LHHVLESAAKPLGDVVLIDCPVVDGATMAALARLDMRAAHVGAQLIVSTSVEALDDVFAALDQSDPQILVGPAGPSGSLRWAMCWLVCRSGGCANCPRRIASCCCA
jgi:hypothetical protein